MSKKILLVYYSRSGKTKKAAQYLCSSINCEAEELIDTKDRRGLLGFIKSGRDAMKGNLTSLSPLTHNPSEYDLVIVGTPVWASHISAPVRTFLEQNKDVLKKVAVFSTQGGSGENSVFHDLSAILNDSPITSLIIPRKNLKDDSYKKIIKDYTKTFQSYL